MAGSQPAVLVDQLPGRVDHPGAALSVLGETLDERDDERRQRGRVLQTRLGVHRADLDRAEPWMGSHVVPEVGVVLDRAAVDERLHARLEVLPAVEARRQPDARERAEDRHAAGGQARLLAAPQRRVGRQRDQQRHIGAQVVGDVDRLLGIGHADVHVHAEHELLARDEAERANQPAVAVVADDALVLPARERVGPRCPDPQPARARALRHERAQGRELAPGRRDIGARRGRDLEHGLQQLGLDLAARRLLADDLVDRAREVQRARIEDHQLLLDPDGVARPDETVLHAGTLPALRSSQRWTLFHSTQPRPVRPSAARTLHIARGNSDRRPSGASRRNGPNASGCT